MNPDNDEGKGDNEETDGRVILKTMRKERKQIKKEMKREEKQKEEERKKLELKFGPKDNRVRIISRELASKLIYSHKPQTHTQQQHLQLTPDDFPSLNETVHRSEIVHFTNYISCSNFENRVINPEQHASSNNIDLNVSRTNESTSRPVETELVKFTEDINYNEFENIQDPNDVNLNVYARGEVNITVANAGIAVKKKHHRSRGRQSRLRYRMRRSKKPYKPLESIALNQSEPEALNLSELEQLRLSETGSFNLSEPKDINLSKPEVLNLSASNILNLVSCQELNLPQPIEVIVSQPQELNLSGSNALNLSGCQELNLPQPNEVNVSERQEINLTESIEPNIKKGRREERKTLELKFGPKDNRVRIISRELLDSHKPQINPHQQHLQLTPDDFPSLNETVHRSQIVHFTDYNSCSNFANLVNTEQHASSNNIDLNVSRANEIASKPIETESMKFTEDINYNVFENIQDPNDVNLNVYSLGEGNITEANEGITVNSEKNQKKRKRGCRGHRLEKGRRRRVKRAVKLCELEELNLSETEALNLSESKDINLSEPEVLNLSESGRQALNLPQPNKVNISQPQELNLSGSNAWNLSGCQELNLSQPNEVNVSETRDINLTASNEPNIKKGRRVNFGPVTVNILDVLKKPENKQKEHKVHKKSKTPYEGNMLDASQPERKRGKQREIPKEKKPSKLKQCIRRDIEQLNAEEMNDIPRYKRFHLDYSKNVITEELNAAVSVFLSNIVRFQENLYARDPIKASARRRYAMGYRTVRKFLLLKRVKILIVGPDIEAKRKGDTLDTMIEDIVSLAAVSDIPYVFALTRRKLGHITIKQVPVSFVAVLNCDGAEKQLDKLLELLKIAREEFEKNMPKPANPQKELTQEVIDNFLSFV